MKQSPPSKACHTDWNVLYLLFIQPGSFENYWLWWGVTDTNHVLVDYIADTSFWLYLSVCHNSKDWHLPNPEKLRDIYMIKFVTSTYQNKWHFCKTVVKRKKWLQGLKTWRSQVSKEKAPKCPDSLFNIFLHVLTLDVVLTLTCQQTNKNHNDFGFYFYDSSIIDECIFNVSCKYTNIHIYMFIIWKVINRKTYALQFLESISALSHAFVWHLCGLTHLVFKNLQEQKNVCKSGSKQTIMLMLTCYKEYITFLFPERFFHL